MMFSFPTFMLFIWNIIDLGRHLCSCPVLTKTVSNVSILSMIFGKMGISDISLLSDGKSFILYELP